MLLMGKWYVLYISIKLFYQRKKNAVVFVYFCFIPCKVFLVVRKHDKNDTWV
jgi:hypothetical protein